MSGLLPGGSLNGSMEAIQAVVGPVAKSIAQVGGNTMQLHSGTVTSNLTEGTTQVLLDIDVNAGGQPITTITIGPPLEEGARVMVQMHPPRGAVCLGELGVAAPLPGIVPNIVQLAVVGPTAIAYPGDQYTLIWMEGCGGGGAGGGAQAEAAGQSSGGGGGGAGMWGRSIYRLDALAWPLSASAGAAGLGVAAGVGGSGGRSFINQFGGANLWACEGGTGGGVVAVGSGTGAAAQGGTSGAGGGFAFQTGYYGGEGQGTQKQVAAIMMGGLGGSSAYAGGGCGRAQAAGNPAKGVGAGGGGASNFNGGSGVNRAGGSGQIGVIQYGFL